MDVVSHEVRLLNRGIAGQAGWRILRIEHRHRTAPCFTRRKPHAAVLHPDIPTGVGHKEAVATDTDRKCHIILFADYEPGHDEVIHVLLVLGVEHDHTAID